MIRAILILAFIVIALPAAADTMTLASTYEAVGTNPDGSKYKGTGVHGFALFYQLLNLLDSTG